MLPIEIESNLKRNNFVNIDIMQGYTLLVKTNLFDNDIPIANLNEYQISIEMQKADGTVIVQTNDTTIVENTLAITCHKSFTAISGKAKLQIVLKKDNMICGTWIINVNIIPSAITENSVVSKNTATIIEEIRLEISKGLQAKADLITSITNAENKAKDIEDRTTSCEQRISNSILEGDASVESHKTAIQDLINKGQVVSKGTFDNYIQGKSMSDTQLVDATLNNDNNIAMRSTLIPSNADLNTYNTNGIYLQNQNSFASSGQNYPTDRAGFLTVYSSSGFVQQIYHEYDVDKEFTRCCYLNTWSKWSEVIKGNSNIMPTSSSGKTTFTGSANNGDAWYSYTKIGEVIYFSWSIVDLTTNSSGTAYATFRVPFTVKEWASCTSNAYKYNGSEYNHWNVAKIGTSSYISNSVIRVNVQSIDVASNTIRAVGVSGLAVLKV